jgi:hypothetical protein
MGPIIQPSNSTPTVSVQHPVADAKCNRVQWGVEYRILAPSRSTSDSGTRLKQSSWEPRVWPPEIISHTQGVAWRPVNLPRATANSGPNNSRVRIAEYRLRAVKSSIYVAQGRPPLHRVNVLYWKCRTCWHKNNQLFYMFIAKTNTHNCW